MSFAPKITLSTREAAIGSRRLGQVLSVPSGRLDKVSVYLEPVVSDEAEASAIMVRLDVYLLDTSRLPTGSPLVSDVIPLADIKGHGLVNFRLETATTSQVGIVLSASGSTQSNYVAWRYATADATGEELLVSEDGGYTWAQDPNHKFAYIAYSFIDDVVDSTDQSASVLPGTLAQAVDDDASDFGLAELTRAAISGDTVRIDFGDFVITLVVDQSGSMTWNDHGNLRLDFLRTYIDDIEATLPPGSSAQYALVKFRSRIIGDLSIVLQESSGTDFLEGVRVVRKIGSQPTGPSDGLVVFEGFATQYLDRNLTAGTKYYYGVFAFDSGDNFSEGRFDSITPQSPPNQPLGVASLDAREIITLVLDFDIGYREVKLTWSNPDIPDYDNVVIVRRTDRFPVSSVDGTAIGTFPLSTNTHTDFIPLSLNPDDHAITGLTYYYAAFAENSVTDLRSSRANSRTASIAITPVNRIWEKAEPPLNVPPPGFDNTAPGNPTGAVATPGNGLLLISWSAADADSRRFRVFYGEREFPKPQTLENGSRNYAGTLVFDGTSTSFVHSGLSNSQPHFYVIVAMDEVGNQSSGIQLTGRPAASSMDSIPPSPINDLSVENVSSSIVRVSWRLNVSRATTVAAYFGDSVRATASLSFEDANPRATTATLEFSEDSRVINLFDEDGQSSQLDPATSDLDPGSILLFERAPARGVTTINSNVLMTPFPTILNQIASASVGFHASLNVKKRGSNDLVTEVVSSPATVRFSNPFGMTISNDPPQIVTVRKWNAACNADTSPGYELSTANGVLARSGQAFSVVIEVTFKGVALDSDIDLAIRVLDKNTGLPSTRISLPQANTAGVSVIRTSTTDDEVIDRSEQPTGETRKKTSIRLSLPPQDLPGEFVVEATGNFEGYTRTVRTDALYHNSLNIDVKTKTFAADGVDFAEQEAFVYAGAFDQPDETKVPVQDLVITKWELTKLGGGGPPSRPFFSRDTVPGTGVKAYTRGGIARNVFFGPGTDIEPSVEETCTSGELYQVRVSASALGMTAEGFGTIELIPFVPRDLKVMFLRLAKEQVDEFGDIVATDELASHIVFSDGEQESAWEVVAKPEDDAETGIRSGVDWKAKVAGAGGVVPVLPDGTVISLVVDVLAGKAGPSDIIIRTDLTSGRRANAKATIIGGKAKFFLKANLRSTGKVKDPTLGNEVSNPFYDTSSVVWKKSPTVISLQTLVVQEINGRPVIFAGGGRNIEVGVPPAFLSFLEPLEIEDPIQ